MTRRAQLVCDSTDSLTDESKYLDSVFSKNDYNPDFVKRNVYKNNEPNTTNTKPVTTATIPYIKGHFWDYRTDLTTLHCTTSRVAHKPITTLRQLLTNVKDRDEPKRQTRSSIQDQMLQLRGLLHWWDWQKSEHTTDWTQMGDEKW